MCFLSQKMKMNDPENEDTLDSGEVFGGVSSGSTLAMWLYWNIHMHGTMVI